MSKKTEEIEIEEMLEELEDEEEEPIENPKPKPKPKGRSKAKKPKSIIARSRVYKFVRSRKTVLKVSRTIFPKLNKMVEDALEKACIRAEANKRKTVHAKDL